MTTRPVKAKLVGMVSSIPLAFSVLLVTAVLVWRQDRREAIHRLPRYGVVLIACLSLALALQQVVRHPVAGGAVAGFALTSMLLAERLAPVKRAVVYLLGVGLLIVGPVSPLVLAVIGVGLLVAVPLKLFAPAAGSRESWGREMKGGGRAVHSSLD